MHAVVHVSLMRRVGGQAGLSLVELVVALMLLSVALLGLAAAFAPSRMAIEGGSQITTAAFLARQTLEQMKNRPYDSDADQITPAFFPDKAYGTIPGFPRYRTTVTIADNTPMTDTKRATVTILYKDDQGIERSTSMTTVFAKSI